MYAFLLLFVGFVVLGVAYDSLMSFLDEKEKKRKYIKEHTDEYIYELIKEYSDISGKINYYKEINNIRNFEKVLKDNDFSILSRISSKKYLLELDLKSKDRLRMLVLKNKELEGYIDRVEKEIFKLSAFDDNFLDRYSELNEYIKYLLDNYKSD